MRILLWVCFSFWICFGSEYVFGNTKNILVPKSKNFVQNLSSEVFNKTGVRIYVDIVDSVSIPSLYPTKELRKKYQQDFLQTLSTPYVAIFLFFQERKIELVSSKDLQDFLNQNELDKIYFDYMAHLLPHKEADITPSRISGVILNGYSEIADRVARHFGVTLENNFSPDEEGVKKFVRFVIYIMLFILIGLFVIVYVSGKRKQGRI